MLFTKVADDEDGEEVPQFEQIDDFQTLSPVEMQRGAHDVRNERALSLNENET